MSQKKDKKRIADLIIGARNKSQDDFEELLSQYSPLIESCVNFYSGGALEKYKDDFRQEATVAFYNSILTYDLGQNNVEFGLYAKICICNALNSQIRLSKKLSIETFQEDIESMEHLSDTIDPSAKLVEKERMEALLKIIQESLSNYEYKIWKLYLSGFSTQEIAKQLNTDPKSVSNAIYRIRVKLKASISNQTK